jgi:hypothetical protein
MNKIMYLKTLIQEQKGNERKQSCHVESILAEFSSKIYFHFPNTRFLRRHCEFMIVTT